MPLFMDDPYLCEGEEESNATGCWEGVTDLGINSLFAVNIKKGLKVIIHKQIFMIPS